MRTRKYQYWYSNKMLEVGSIQFMEDGSYIVNDELVGGKLREWTGLKDKNGKEIYEGDLVRHRDLDKRDDSIRYGLVETLIGRKAVEVKWAYCSFFPFGGWIDIPDLEYEVIGNVWENPDLINP